MPIKVIELARPRSSTGNHVMDNVAMQGSTGPCSIPIRTREINKPIAPPVMNANEAAIYIASV